MMKCYFIFLLISFLYLIVCCLLCDLFICLKYDFRRFIYHPHHQQSLKAFDLLEPLIQIVVQNFQQLNPILKTEISDNSNSNNNKRVMIKSMK